MQVEIPLSESQPTGYTRGRVVLALDGDQRVTLRRIQDAMIAAETTLADGKVVKSPSDAVKAILETVAAAE